MAATTPRICSRVASFRITTSTRVSPPWPRRDCRRKPTCYDPAPRVHPGAWMNALFRTQGVADIQATLDEAQGVHGLKRTLTAFDLVMLGIGAVIGAGIFSAIGTAAV